MAKNIIVLLVIMFAIPPFIYSEETYSVSGVITIFQEGDIHIGIFTKEDFATRKEKMPLPPYFQIIKLTPEQIASKKVPFLFRGIKKGVYTMLAYQDVNGNGIIDRKIAGSLAEPRGQYRVPEFGWSAWNDIKFDLDQNMSGIEILMVIVTP